VFVADLDMPYMQAFCDCYCFRCAVLVRDLGNSISGFMARIPTESELVEARQKIWELFQELQPVSIPDLVAEIVSRQLLPAHVLEYLRSTGKLQ
jgi:hypothetical protein